MIWTPFFLLVHDFLFPTSFLVSAIFLNIIFFELIHHKYLISHSKYSIFSKMFTIFAVQFDHILGSQRDIILHGLKFFLYNVRLIHQFCDLDFFYVIMCIQ